MYTYLKNVDVEFVKTRAERQTVLKNAAIEKTMHLLQKNIINV
jgi:hypothetical protein